MDVQPGVRLPSSTVAAVEPASVFGPKFVDLRPGAGEATGPYLAAGAVITRHRASRSTCRTRWATPTGA